MKKSELLKIAKPILFNTEMTRAVMAERKTQTRRIIKDAPYKTYRVEPGETTEDGRIVDWDFQYGICDPNGGDPIFYEMYKTIKPRYAAGDFLYIRETWERFQCVNCEGDETGRCFNNPDNSEGCYVYRATHYINGDAHWHPSIHMPKEAARTFLQVTDVWPQELQNITEEQANAEGCSGIFTGDGSSIGSGWEKTPVDEFVDVWNSTIPPKDRDKYAWAANPWVWVIEFERVEVQE